MPVALRPAQTSVAQASLTADQSIESMTDVQASAEELTSPAEVQGAIEDSALPADTADNIVVQGAVEDSMPPAEVSASAQELEIPARFGASVTTSSAGFDEILGVNAFVPLVQTGGEDITFLEGAVQLIEDEPSVSLSVGHRRYDPSDNVVRGRLHWGR